MTAPQVKDFIKHMARTQGYYNSLYNRIEDYENPTALYEEIGDGCEDTIDIVMKLETDA